MRREKLAAFREAAKLLIKSVLFYGKFKKREKNFLRALPGLREQNCAIAPFGVFFETHFWLSNQKVFQRRLRRQYKLNLEESPQRKEMRYFVQRFPKKTYDAFFSVFF